MANEPMANMQHITSGAGFEALGLPYRVRIPPGDGLHPTLIMVHGIDGSEDVTWVFGRVAGPQWLILSPRAPLATTGGFSWYPSTPPTLQPPAEAFTAGLTAFERFVDGALRYYPVDRTRLVLLGFSQGSAMIYADALRQPRLHPVAGIAALSGFIAQVDPLELPPQNGLPVLMLHGTQDERVPVSVAHRDRERLRAAGASVTYEESAIGHKVSAAGMRLLAHWLASLLS